MEKRLYEVTFLCSPHLSQGNLGQVLGNLEKQVLEQGGELLHDSCEYWGLRNTAYEIRKDRKRYRKAHYVLAYFSLPQAALPIIDRYIKFRCAGDILRFLNLKIDELPKEPSGLFESSLDRIMGISSKTPKAEAEKDTEERSPGIESTEKDTSKTKGDFSGHQINYKNLRSLFRFSSAGGRILPGRITRVKAKNQRRVSQEIKRARFLSLMPYVVQ